MARASKNIIILWLEHQTRAYYYLNLRLEHLWLEPLSLLQVTQPVGYLGALPVICINESMAEWTARDCYVSLKAALPLFSSIKLLCN
jgi:hypothetical protein